MNITKKYHNDGGFKFLLKDAKHLFSVRRVRKTSLIVICSILVFWLIWELTVQRKAVTSAVGCKNRLAEVSQTYMGCYQMCQSSASDTF